MAAARSGDDAPTLVVTMTLDTHVVFRVPGSRAPVLKNAWFEYDDEYAHRGNVRACGATAVSGERCIRAVSSREINEIGPGDQLVRTATPPWYSPRKQPRVCFIAYDAQTYPGFEDKAQTPGTPLNDLVRTISKGRPVVYLPEQARLVTRSSPLVLGRPEDEFPFEALFPVDLWPVYASVLLIFCLLCFL